ncbi:RNase adapter RapZ [Crenobacter luteus]|uniref:RNase adaptor protein RapZ n=1 Tax=Crenobacter luteus TaxID=1452487 RepID=A0A163CF17_9NEIS|nr:RNase adapter RapZ [Crenobacter luteus]KZE31711.1 RNase adaptor protein RapZ [Crenobacter luteus]
MQLILISGLSGSGKSVALKALEDAGYASVDNLPATLLASLIALYREQGHERVAISVDTRGGPTLAALPGAMAALAAEGVDVRLLYLEAKSDTLVRRFSETRRRHPLSGPGLTVEESIRQEEAMLAEVKALGYPIDTSELSANRLRTWIKALVGAEAGRLTLVFESFGFKHGVPLDADLVFDVRCLPNPFYDPRLRPLTGLDQPIVDFLLQESSVAEMVNDIRRFLDKWLPAYRQENRSYLTVAVGCTGGQHRSVFVVETLARAFADEQVLVRHRELPEAR